MFPFSNPMIPFFENAKKVASNIPAYGEKGEYTVDMFSSDFPQFYSKGTAEETDPDTGAPQRTNTCRVIWYGLRSIL